MYNFIILHTKYNNLFVVIVDKYVFHLQQL
jgi:hypothetical protein